MMSFDNLSEKTIDFVDLVHNFSKNTDEYLLLKYENNESSQSITSSVTNFHDKNNLFNNLFLSVESQGVCSLEDNDSISIHLDDGKKLIYIFNVEYEDVKNFMNNFSKIECIESL